MKKYTYQTVFTFLFCVFFAGTTTAQGWWFRKADYNQSARTAAAVFTAGTGAFVGTGYDSTGFRRNFSVYNTTNDTWTAVQSLGNAIGSGLSRDAAAAFSIGNKGYVVMGQGSNPFLNDTWEYDAGGDVWTQKANFSGTPRRSAAGFAYNSLGYIVCGQTATGFSNELWMYDPVANSWTAKAAFPGTARRLPVAMVIGTDVYVGTGDDGTFKKDFFKYTPSSNSWVAAPAYGGTPRYGASAFVIGTDGYVGTGYDNSLSNKKDFWKFSTTTNTWSAVKDFSGTARANAVAFSNGTVGFVATGYDSLPEKDLWLYDPLSNGVNEINQLKASIKIYPNPMADEATLAFNADAFNAFGNIAFTLYDLQGRMVIRKDHLQTSEFHFSRGDLTAGLYVYNVTGDGIPVKSGKLIIR